MGKGRGECFYFFCFFTFIPVLLSSLSLSFFSSTLSSVSFLPFSGRRHKMTLKGWRVIKPQHNQSISHKAETCYRKYRLYFCHTCFSMGDLSVQVSVFCSSVHLSVHPFIDLSTFILVFWAQHLLQFYTDHFETLHAFSSWYEDVHVVSILIFHPQYIDSVSLLWAQHLLQFCTDHFEILPVLFSWYEDVHMVWI